TCADPPRRGPARGCRRGTPPAPSRPPRRPRRRAAPSPPRCRDRGRGARIGTMPHVAGATHTSHWGAYTAQVRDGELVGIEPRADDPLPSPLLGNIVSANGAARVAHPAVRRGWLENGPGPDR